MAIQLPYVCTSASAMPLHRAEKKNSHAHKQALWLQIAIKRSLYGRRAAVTICKVGDSKKKNYSTSSLSCFAATIAIACACTAAAVVVSPLPLDKSVGIATRGSAAADTSYPDERSLHPH